MHAQIGLQNLSPVPIRVMRVAATIDAGENKIAKRELELLGLEVTITAVSTEDGFEHDDVFEPLVLPPASYVDKAIVMSCTADPGTSAQLMAK